MAASTRWWGLFCVIPTCIRARPRTFARTGHPSVACDLPQATGRLCATIRLVGGGSPAILATFVIRMGSAAIFIAKMAAAAIISGETGNVRLWHMRTCTDMRRSHPFATGRVTMAGLQLWRVAFDVVRDRGALSSTTRLLGGLSPRPYSGLPVMRPKRLVPTPLQKTESTTLQSAPCMLNDARSAPKPRKEAKM